MIEIEQLREATEANVRDLNELMQQLRKDSPIQDSQATLTELQALVADKNTVLIVAKDGERIVGAALLAIILKIGKAIGSVEDVVVHEAYRGKGLGEQIMKKVIETAKERGLVTLGLTSRPIRVAGNKLYQKMGFTIKETNVYRLKL